MKVPNWFNYSHFYDKIAARNDFAVFVELGAWKGDSIGYLASKLLPRKGEVEIYTVDLFEDSKANPDVAHIVPHIYQLFERNLEQMGVRDMVQDIKGISWEVADQFKDASVDFLFIDANHSYESVIQDIIQWLPKIRKGGIISGHDYYAAEGVQRAVKETFSNEFEVTDQGGVWHTEM